MTDRLLNDRELSRRIGRARSTLQKDRVAGRGVPYVRVGSLVRYRESDVEFYLASLQVRRSTSEPDAS
jgi:predicted DNA-binding transcriptional regulator AlpA